jgi:hypothetical protein
MIKIANGQRMAITVFTDNDSEHLNIELIRLLSVRVKICQQYIQTERPDIRVNAICLFEQYNEQIKQLLGL